MTEKTSHVEINGSHVLNGRTSVIMRAIEMLKNDCAEKGIDLKKTRVELIATISE